VGIDTIETYSKFINNCEVNFLYNENSNFPLFPDFERHVEVIADDFPIDFYNSIEIHYSLYRRRWEMQRIYL